MLAFMSRLPVWLAQSIGAVFILAIVFEFCWLAGVPAGHQFGAVAGIFFYYGREVSQYQAGLALSTRTSIRQLWHRGWFPFEWNGGKVMELLCPIISCILAALALQAWG